MKKVLNFDDVIPITYKRPHKAPVKLSYDSECNELTITANVSFSKSLLRGYENFVAKAIREKMGPSKPEEKTFADVAEEGIIYNWGGTYDMTPWDGPKELHVKVIINRQDRGDVPKGQRCFRIQRVYGNGTSFVTSPPWRWLWGIITGNKECFFTLNWHPYYPGTISMNKYRSKRWFQSTVSHEFGHVLGLGDAYDAFYRFYYEAPGTQRYMMNFNNTVAPEEIMMAMRAHKLRKMQYFPCVFNWNHVWTNIKRSIFNNH